MSDTFVSCCFMAPSKVLNCGSSSCRDLTHNLHAYSPFSLCVVLVLVVLSHSARLSSALAADLYIHSQQRSLTLNSSQRGHVGSRHSGREYVIPVVIPTPTWWRSVVFWWTRRKLWIGWTRISMWSKTSLKPRKNWKDGWVP